MERSVVASLGVGETPGHLGASRDAIAVPTVAEIYEQHFRFVWRTLRRLGISDTDVDDAVQDVFLVVHRRLNDFQPNAPVKNWLFGIVTRVARDRRRSQKRRDPVRHGLEPVVELEGVEDEGQQGPGESAERAAAARLIRTLLQQMDERRREVFVLADLEQMSAPEIAQILQLPLNTVYSRLRTARQEFEEALARHRDQETKLP